MRIGLAFTLSLPYTDNLPYLSGECLSAFESGEQIYPVNNSPSQHTCEQLVRVVWGERKAYPHEVCSDRNRIRLRVNKDEKSVQILVNAIPIQ